MLRSITLLLFVSILVSCNNDEAEDKTADTIIAPSVKDDDNAGSKDISGCYLRAVERDTLAASLTQNGNNITGKLVFDNYEKDGSSGSVSGKKDGDILKLVYRFQSEGMNSISEVFFKITSNGLIHGIGEIEVKGDSAYYSSPDNITYSEKDELRKINCTEADL